MSIIINAGILPEAFVGVSYQHVLTASVSEGEQILSWNAPPESLPQGITLDPNTGVLSGTPTDEGFSSNFSVKVVEVTITCTGNFSAGNTTIRIKVNRFNNSDSVIKFLEQNTDFEKQLDFSLFSSIASNLSPTSDGYVELFKRYEVENIYITPEDQIVHKVQFNLE